MPIEVGIGIRPCDLGEFRVLDRVIMGVAFDVHNEFGRLLSEEVYKRELEARCLTRGISSVDREVRLRVTHEDFAKDYWMDLLFCHGSMLEAKATECLVAVHRTQAIN